jgi:predicted metal-dependent HD superfamily phosphohydrolase
MIEEVFKSMINRYCTDTNLRDTLFHELSSRYSEPHRHYHTLAHIDSMIGELQPVQDMTEDQDTLLFAVCYHDVVYDPKKGDNEERSAELAVRQLQAINYPPDRTERCAQHILATQMHKASHDADTNLLVDADLSILGKPWAQYEAYVQAIRQEYIHVPEALFRMGRKGVLQRFLAMERIYKTEFFFDKYEQRAHQNLLQEVDML